MITINVDMSRAYYYSQRGGADRADDVDTDELADQVRATASEAGGNDGYMFEGTEAQYRPQPFMVPRERAPVFIGPDGSVLYDEPVYPHPIEYASAVPPMVMRFTNGGSDQHHLDAQAQKAAASFSQDVDAAAMQIAPIPQLLDAKPNEDKPLGSGSTPRDPGAIWVERSASEGDQPGRYDPRPPPGGYPSGNPDKWTPKPDKPRPAPIPKPPTESKPGKPTKGGPPPADDSSRMRLPVEPDQPGPILMKRGRGADNDDGMPPKKMNEVDEDDINRQMRGWTRHGFRGVVAADEIDTLKDSVGRGDRMAFIMNTDTRDKPGAHWVAVEIEWSVRPAVHYYDPFGDDPDRRTVKALQALVAERRRLRPNQEPLKFKVNKVANQRENSSSCGLHSMRFVREMLSGKAFNAVTSYNTRDGEKRARAMLGGRRMPRFRYIL